VARLTPLGITSITISTAPALLAFHLSALVARNHQTFLTSLWPVAAAVVETLAVEAVPVA
jgi:hypothetical protein